MINVDNQHFASSTEVPRARVPQVATAGSWYRNGGKRLFDVTASAMGLVVLTPVLAVIAAVIFLYDRGKPIFVHRRLGQGGESFGCIKLRSMAMDAEERLKGMLDSSPEMRREWNETQKLTNDPRVTRIGNFLRKTSLDELPQLFNVLKGEMSLVGPRPIVLDELPRYGSDAVAYLRVRPGLTGLWQTTGRNDVSYQERVDMDVAYERDISFMEDLRIMAMTIVTMLRRTGK